MTAHSNKRAGILLVGPSSLIAQSVIQTDPTFSWRTASAREPLTPEILDGIATIVNFALHPDYRTTEYNEENDLDLRMAREIQNQPIHYILLSSRKVYAMEHQFGIKEEGPIEPQGHYGINKFRTEQTLQNLLGPKLTTLRISNILGDERIPGRKSFMSMMLGGLIEKDTITMDVNPSVRRDFISTSACGKALLKVALDPEPGIFNFGSGDPVAMGTIADALMTGFGRGTVDVINDRVFDEFVLNVEKWNQRYGAIEGTPELLEFCKNLGRKYAHIS